MKRNSPLPTQKALKGAITRTRGYLFITKVWSIGKILGVCACLYHSLKIMPAVAFPLEVSAFSDAKFDDLPSDLKRYLEGKINTNYQFKIAKISWPNSSITAVRFISKECVSNFCHTFFEYDGKFKSSLFLISSEWMRLYQNQRPSAPDGTPTLEIRQPLGKTFIDFTPMGPSLEQRP